MNNEDEFTVQDHRSGASETGETQSANKNAAQRQTQLGSEAQEHRQDPGPDHDLDFSTFVISLASSAQVNLGAMPHPETNQTARNFPGGQADDRYPDHAADQDEGELDRGRGGSRRTGPVQYSHALCQGRGRAKKTRRVTTGPAGPLFSIIFSSLPSFLQPSSLPPSSWCRRTASRTPSSLTPFRTLPYYRNRNE